MNETTASSSDPSVPAEPVPPGVAMVLWCACAAFVEDAGSKAWAGMPVVRWSLLVDGQPVPGYYHQLPNLVTIGETAFNFGSVEFPAYAPILMAGPTDGDEIDLTACLVPIRLRSGQRIEIEIATTEASPVDVWATVRGWQLPDDGVAGCC